MAAGSQSFDDELAELFELSQDAFCIAGFDGYLKRANPAFPRSTNHYRIGHWPWLGDPVTTRPA
jgi:hypothetical protein